MKDKNPLYVAQLIKEMQLHSYSFRSGSEGKFIKQHLFLK